MLDTGSREVPDQVLDDERPNTEAKSLTTGPKSVSSLFSSVSEVILHVQAEALID